MDVNNALKLEAVEETVASKGSIYLFFKRLFDIVCSLFAIIILSPLFIVTAILIKLDSNGPVFFIQKRCGKGAKEFNMLKFRSMVCNAEELLDNLKEKNEQTGPAFKIKDDPRITRVGKFIRKTSIDELPQLFNILKGDMSIVGPRPPLPREVKQYGPYEKLRLAVKPGLTCYWQVMGRDSIGFDEWVKLDIKYIQDRNFWLDLKLIFKTFKVFFGDENAA
ncbi:MAG: sugar transferase [Clostridiales bacterium]|nr:sugar transferase [Clostridiales bacterium]HBM81114.1 multidrug MFS transporter [Clostridiaceae bacterium]